MDQIFYKVVQQVNGDQDYTFDIEIDIDHPVFEGHFPGQPVLPGVLQLKLIVDMCQLALGQSLKLKEILLAKYLHFIDPRQSPAIQVIVQIKSTDEGHIVYGQLKDYKTIFSKIQIKLSAN